MSKWSSPNFYRYKCNNCGAPHRHRNHNKYPDLCEACAKSQAATDRHIAKMRQKLMFNPKPRRNKKLLILLLPIIACVFIIGWVMCMVGDNAQVQHRKRQEATIS